MTIAPMDAARMVRAFTGCHEGTSISGSASTLQRTAAPFDSHRKPYDTERMSTTPWYSHIHGYVGVGETCWSVDRANRRRRLRGVFSGIASLQRLLVMI